MSEDELEEQGILDEIVNRFVNTKFSDLKEVLKKEILNYLKFKLDMKDIITKDSVNKLFQDKEKYRRFIKKYVLDLLRTEDHLLPTGMDEIKRNILVSDKTAANTLKRLREGSGIEFAERYVFDESKNRKRINNSLVEEKLLTMYLEERSI